jgi:hypothetical protein
MERPEQDIITNLPVPGQMARQQAGSAPGEVIFDLKNVSIWYSAFKAVTDVSMAVHEHEITAFIGSSGSGKTTVLRAFNRMNDLVAGARLEGEVSYRGEPLYGKDVSATAVRRRIGMVFQKPNPFDAGQRPHRLLLCPHRQRRRCPDRCARRVRPDRADFPGSEGQPYQGLRHRPDGLSRQARVPVADVLTEPGSRRRGCPAHAGGSRHRSGLNSTQRSRRVRVK